MSENKLWEKYRQAFGFLAFSLNNCPNADIVRQLRDMFCGPKAAFSGENIHVANRIITDYWQERLDTPLEDVVQELATDWTRLFRGVSPGYGPLPPYGGVYCENDGIGTKTILKVNQEYLEQGLGISEEQNDRADYLGYELDFIKHLAERAATAQEQGRTEEEETYRNLICRFINEHVSTWVGDFCSQAASYVRTDYFKGFLMLLDDTVAEVADSLR